MDFFFYSVLLLLLFLCPISVRSEGSFWLEKRLSVLSVRLFFIKILNIKLLFSEDGLYLSLNGKKGRSIPESSSEKKEKKISLTAFLDAIHVKNAMLTVYAGGDAASLSILLASMKESFGSVMGYLTERKRLDKCRITILPCYLNDQTTVNFSISLFSCAALILFVLAHTKKGEKHAKRSDRKYHG